MAPLYNNKWQEGAMDKSCMTTVVSSLNVAFERFELLIVVDDSFPLITNNIKSAHMLPYHYRLDKKLVKLTHTLRRHGANLIFNYTTKIPLYPVH